MFVNTGASLFNVKVSSDQLPAAHPDSLRRGVRTNLPRRSSCRTLLPAVVITIEFVLVAEQPLFAHAGERRFGRHAPHPGNNRRQRSRTDHRLQSTLFGAGLKWESFGACTHSPSVLQRLCPQTSVARLNTTHRLWTVPSGCAYRLGLPPVKLNGWESGHVRWHHAREGWPHHLRGHAIQLLERGSEWRSPRTLDAQDRQQDADGRSCDQSQYE